MDGKTYERHGIHIRVPLLLYARRTLSLTTGLEDRWEASDGKSREIYDSVVNGILYPNEETYISLGLIVN